MPKIYRSMKREDGKPAIGNNATSLGVRVPQDIDPDAAGDVHPGPHGMSVSPSVDRLPMMFIPRRLSERFPKAVGSNNLHIWEMGEGPWVAGGVAPALGLVPDPLKADRHGFVSPNLIMSLADYRAALAATQGTWSLIESYT
jgi:hypothetical protein